MEGDELFVFVVAGIAALSGFSRIFFVGMPGLYFRRLPGLGLVRIAVLLAMAWVVYVLYHYADPSVIGIYRVFYIVLGLAIVTCCGLGGARAAGVRYRVDVIERANPYAAVITAAQILAVAMIYAGSVWGEADPDGDDEGGWWIPMGFFFAGWISLVIAMNLYASRDSHGNRGRIRRRRSPADAQAVAFYILSSGWILAEAVSGDFYGWGHGLLAVGAIAGMLITREIFGGIMARGGADPSRPARLFESILYITWSAGFWWASRWIFNGAGQP